MKMVRAIVLTCIVGLLPTASSGQTIVWTDQYARRIQRKHVNGAEVQTIVQFPFPTSASAVHYDPFAAKLYYLLYDGASVFIQRANLDGSDPENIPTPSVGYFTLNIDSRKLYWISQGNVLNRSDLDGTGVQSHTYPTCCLLTLEAFGGDLFFGAGGAMTKGIWRADADGSSEQFVHGTGQPMDLAYDPAANRLYVAVIDAIFRMNPDGTGFGLVVKLPQWQLGGGPQQVVVDSHGRKLYWAENYEQVIRRSNLDGSNVEDFVTASDVGNPNFDIRGLTIVYSETPIPAVSAWGLITMAAFALTTGVFIILRGRLGSRPRACKNVLAAKFGRSAIKAVAKTKSGSFMVATSPTVNGRSFCFPQ